MSTPTLRDEYVKALTAKGYTLTKRTPKSLVYTKANWPNFYLGGKGSARFGTSKATSFVLSPTMKDRLLSGSPKFDEWANFWGSANA